MTAEGHTVASLTGGIEGSVRDKVIDDFREGRAKVLITTNVLARGIDVSTVSMVMNYVRDSIRKPIDLILTMFRISLNTTNLVNHAWQTPRHISTVSVVLADLGVSV
jgi:excinuclease UvrABC helicase subunit UvrB